MQTLDDAWNAPDPDPESAMQHLFGDSPQHGGHAEGSGNEKRGAIQTTGGEATPGDPPASGGPGGEQSE